MDEVEIVDYKAHWKREFNTIADELRSIVGDSALRIDHIGSTSIFGMPAKDIIDI